MRTRTAAVALVVALGLPVLPLTAAGAADEPGSGFASVSLLAVARGEEFLFRPEIPGQLSVPYAESAIKLGEGASKATVAWPGDTAATLGTTLLVLRPELPPQTTALNYPAVAYARSGGAQEASNTSVPGAVMRATATGNKATAVASAEGAAVLSATAGATTSQSAVEVTGPTSATGTASSTVRDVTIGPVRVGSVTSTARGTTDGVTATATGSTTVTGVTVAGVAVTVDEQGVSVAGTTVVPPGAADAVTAALSQAQITLVLTKPVKAVSGGRVEYSTGGLVAVTPLGTVTLGGAQLTLAATRDDGGTAVEPPAPVPTDVPTGVAPPPAPGLPGVGTTGGAPGLSPEVPVQPTVPREGGGPLALVPLSVRTGYGWAWVASGLLLSFLAASGLLALSRRWLAPDLSGCPLEGRLP